MKKIILLTLVISSLIVGCESPASTDSYSGRVSGEQASSPLASPSSISETLDSLRAGVLPDPSLTKEEEKLAGILVREVNPEFPLKIGVLLYQRSASLDKKIRSKSYEGFIEKIKNNQNIGQVLEISPGLISAGADIEEIRKLGARFQVSQILVVNDSYQTPIENKEAVVTPIDAVTGDRTWESFSKIEVYSLDILNGVFAFSTSSGERASKKYNKDSSFENKDKKLIEESSNKAWEKIEIKVLDEINEFEKRINKGE